MKPSYAPTSLPRTSRSVGASRFVGVDSSRPTKARAYASLTAVAALMILAGCGGAGSSRGAGSRKARATLRVLWPDRNARLVPNAANSLVVQLSKGGSVVDTKTIARPASGQNQTQTDFAGLEEAAYDVAIKAYPNADGSGVAQASGAGVLNAKIDGSGTVTVSLASTVSTVVVTPAASSATVGGTTTVTASAKDAQGNIVLLSAGGGTENVVWASDAPGVATVSGTGLTATLTGVAAGTANVTATLTTDDAGTLKSGGAPITITAAVTGGLLGQIAWTANFGWDTYVPATVGEDGTVYIGAAGRFRALDGNGAPKWTFGNADDTTPAGLSPDGQTVYGGLRISGDEDPDTATVYALDLSGHQKWAFLIPGGETSNTRYATDSAGTIYFGTNGGHFIALNPNGALKWSIEPTQIGQVVTNPVIAADGTIYTGTTDGNLLAVRPNGSIKWTFPVGGYMYTTPTLGPDGTIYVGGSDNSTKVFAINPNGSQKWACNVGGSTYGKVALGSDGTVYAGVSDGKVYAIAPNGTIKWSSPTSASIWADVTIDKSGAICALDSEGHAYGFRPDGSQKWTLALGAQPSSQLTMGPDGRIYVNLNGGGFVAIR